jgi:hypothetical protein
LSNLRTNHTHELKSVRDDHENKFKDNHSSHTNEIGQMRTKYDQVVTGHENDIEKRKTKYLGDLLNQKDEHDAVVDNMTKEHVISNQVTRAEHERSMDGLRNQ